MSDQGAQKSGFSHWFDRLTRMERTIERIWNWCGHNRDQSKAILDKLDQILRRLGATPVSSVRFSLPQFSDKEGNPMPSSITLPDDQSVNVPLVFRDAVGVIHAPPDGGSVSSDNPAVATATVAADDGSIDVLSVADGVATITYTNGAVSDTLTVTVAQPTPTSVEFNAGGATFTPDTP